MFDRRARSVIFYTTMVVVLLVLVTRTQQQFLPSGLARQVGHNSEAFLFALLVAAEIQLLRNRARTPRLLVAMATLGVVFIVLGLSLRQSALPGTLTTLNEPVIGAGFLLFYLCLPRSRMTALLAVLSVTLCIAVLFDTSFVLDQAESLVPLVLAGPAIDIFDPRLLGGDSVGTRALWVTWMVTLTLLAVVFIPLGAWARAEDLGAGAETTIDYLRRAIEGYWGWLFVHAYFAFWLGAQWRNAGSVDQGRRGRHRSPVPRGAVPAQQA
jgi:hypothetical protein